MSGRTSRFELTTLDESGEKFDHDSWRFGVFNRHLIDRVLMYAAEQHIHDGSVVASSPPAAPKLAVLTTGLGLIGPGEQAYYRYALVDPTGLEGTASEVAVARTPNQISPPRSPAVTPTVGFLPSGVYIYITTWWTGDARCETQGGPAATVSAVGRSETFSVGNIVEVGAIDPAADGWNLYRRGPLDTAWWRVASIPRSDQSYVDDGTFDVPPVQAEPPIANGTFGRCSVEVEIPFEGDQGQWKIYRTYNPTDWQDSLIGWVSAPVGFVDQGLPGSTGSPMDSSEALSGLEPIDLLNETEGGLPSGLITTPTQIQFAIEGVVEPGYSRFIWINEFEIADVMTIRARLMNGQADERAVIVGLEHRPLDGQWAELERCRVYIDPFTSESSLLEVPPNFGEVLRAGDALRALVIQDGGGSHAESDLVISLMLLAHYGSTEQSYAWSP